jgi:hypothetical protein
VVAIESDEDGSGERVYLFRTYSQDNPLAKNPGPAHTHKVWEVARATSAAPTFFQPIRLNNKDYSDGGVGNNNPAQLMLDEVIYKAGEESLSAALGVLVSIGAGQKPTKRLRVKKKYPGLSSLKIVKEASRILRHLKDTSTDVEAIHKHVSDRCKDNKFNHYYRWTGGPEVGGLAMDEWLPKQHGKTPPTAEFIEKHVKAYMAQDEQQDALMKCARELVKRRRQRISFQPERGLFRRFTECSMLECQFCDDLLENREVAKSHILKQHPQQLVEDFPIDSLVKILKEKPPRSLGGPL